MIAVAIIRNSGPKYSGSVDRVTGAIGQGQHSDKAMLPTMPIKSLRDAGWIIQRTNRDGA
jgi:hypothetical protein